jgi:hypothetical protein
MFFISAWVLSDEATFDESVPLRFCAQHLRRIGSRQEFTVLILRGYGNLSSAYISDLARDGFYVVDASAECERIAANHRELERFNLYERLCFLRWPILQQHVERERTLGQLFHLDADIIFGTLPEEIAAECEGRTFALQGVPAFVTIANRDWLPAYSEQLKRFSRDIEGYSNAAYADKADWHGSHHEWIGYPDRNPLASDQDLVQHLVHSGTLPQSDPVDFVRSNKLHYAVNPLYPHHHSHLYLGKLSGIEFKSDGQTCTFEGRPMAFWHFQNDCARYFDNAQTLLRLRWPFRIHVHTPGKAQPKLRRLPLLQPKSRTAVCRNIRELSPDTGTMSFADVYNARAFWLKGFFANERVLSAG